LKNHAVENQAESEWLHMDTKEMTAEVPAYTLGADNARPQGKRAEHKQLLNNNLRK